MKTVKVVAAVIKAVNQKGEPIIFATQLNSKTTPTKASETPRWSCR